MPNPVFPFNDVQDSSGFSMKQEDVTLRSPVEGGYVYTRARHTRAPRRTWTSKVSDITDAQKQTFEAFVNTVKVGSVIFDWKLPIANTIIPVRFVTPPQFTYKGIGSAFRWEVTFEVEEV